MTLLGDVGVPPAVEVGIDVTWGDALLWYAPFSGPEGLGFWVPSWGRCGPGGVCGTGVLLVSRVGWQEADTLAVGRGLGRLV